MTTKDIIRKIKIARVSGKTLEQLSKELNINMVRLIACEKEMWRQVGCPEELL